MLFIGSLGIGKIVVVIWMVDILYKLGYIEKGYLIMVMCDDLVG